MKASRVFAARSDAPSTAQASHALLFNFFCGKRSIGSSHEKMFKDQFAEEDKEASERQTQVVLEQQQQRMLQSWITGLLTAQ